MSFSFPPGSVGVHGLDLSKNGLHYGERVVVVVALAVAAVVLVAVTAVAVLENVVTGEAQQAGAVASGSDAVEADGTAAVTSDVDAVALVVVLPAAPPHTCHAAMSHHTFRAFHPGPCHAAAAAVALVEQGAAASACPSVVWASVAESADSP